MRPSRCSPPQFEDPAAAAAEVAALAAAEARFWRSRAPQRQRRRLPSRQPARRRGLGPERLGRARRTCRRTRPRISATSTPSAAARWLDEGRITALRARTGERRGAPRRLVSPLVRPAARGGDSRGAGGRRGRTACGALSLGDVDALVELDAPSSRAPGGVARLLRQPSAPTTLTSCGPRSSPILARRSRRARRRARRPNRGRIRDSSGRAFECRTSACRGHRERRCSVGRRRCPTSVDRARDARSPTPPSPGRGAVDTQRSSPTGASRTCSHRAFGRAVVSGRRSCASTATSRSARRDAVRVSRVRAQRRRTTRSCCVRAARRVDRGRRRGRPGRASFPALRPAARGARHAWRHGHPRRRAARSAAARRSGRPSPGGPRGRRSSELERLGVPTRRQTHPRCRRPGTPGWEPRARGLVARPSAARAFRGRVEVHDAESEELVAVGEAGRADATRESSARRNRSRRHA